MARSVTEWVGRTDDAMPPPRVKDRIRERQGNKCALTGVSLGSDDKVQYDHITPLWLGGRNAESNLQAVTAEAHKVKTKAEATVRAKCNRTRKKHLGIKSDKRSGFNTRFIKKMDGSVIDRRTGEVIKEGRR